MQNPRCALVVAAFVAASLPTRTEAAAASDPPEADSVLDASRRNLRGNQVSIDGFGGSLIGGSIGHSYVAGARVTYFPIRQLGIGAAYGNSYVFSDRGLLPLDNRTVHYIHGRLELPIASALRLGRRHTVQMDLFGEGGAGAVYLGERWEPLGAVGGGVRIYPRIAWLAITVNVLTYLHYTKQELRKVFDGDVAFTLGLALVLPRRR
jgi:hypothetical protein